MIRKEFQTATFSEWGLVARRRGNNVSLLEPYEGGSRVANPHDYGSSILSELLRLAEENEDLKLRLEEAP